LIPGTLEGGNFCDCYVHDNLLFICVGDTECEGVEASMLATMTKAQFRTASAYEKQPKQILTAILQTVGNMEELSIKLFVGVLDLATGHLTYANANQNAPIIMDGELKKLDLAKQETDIQPGTLLFFYTDMFIQAENKERKKYGEKRILGNALQAMKMDPTPQPFVNSMIEGVKTFTEGKHQQSDISVCAIKYAP
jgi:serine phosphatase RsbU (regulator of sigma subunit)